MSVHLLFALALAMGAVYGSPALAAATTAEGRVGNPAAVSPEEGTPRGNLLWTIPLKTLTATRERPIFRSSRRPVAIPAAGTRESVSRIEPAPAPPRLALVGTVIGSDQGIAVFVNQSTRDTFRLRMGENHEGWILREVRGREVVLQRAQETIVFSFPAPENKNPVSESQDPKVKPAL